MRVFFLGLLCCILLQGYSQKFVKTYYNEAWALTSKNMATYCRVGFIDTLDYTYYGVVNDYYLKSGKLQMTGNYIGNNKHGTFHFFYPDGTIKTEGSYLKDVRNGIWSNYYENGSFKDKLLFDNDEVIPISYYDSNGVQKLDQGTGEWITEYFDDLNQSQITINAYFQDSLREGEWNFYIRQIINDTLGIPLHGRSETYHQGKFVTGKGYAWERVIDLTLPTRQLVPEPKKFFNTEHWICSQYACIEEYPSLKFLPKLDSTLLPLDSLAEFPGGIDSLTRTIIHNRGILKCGMESYDKTYEFKITIDIYGNLSFKTDYIYKDDFYKEVIRVINKQPSWKPAKRNNKKVPNYFSLIVNLKDGHVRAWMQSYNELRKTAL